MKKILVLFSSFLIIVASLFISTNSTEASSDVYEFVPENPEEYIRACDWEKPTPDAKLVKIVHVKHSDLMSTEVVENNDVSITPLNGGGQYIKKIRSEVPVCGTTVRARTSGTGAGNNGKLVLNQDVTVSNMYKADIKIDTKMLTTAVGYDVTKTFTKNAYHSINTNNKNYQIIAYDDYEVQNFEVWNDPWGIFETPDVYLGSGASYRHVGYCYVVYEI